jgi:hypothetical protein
MKYTRDAASDINNTYRVTVVVENKDADAEKTYHMTPEQMKVCFFNPYFPNPEEQQTGHEILKILKSCVGKQVRDIVGIDEADHDLVPKVAWDNDGFSRLASVDIVFFCAKGLAYEVTL